MKCNFDNPQDEILDDNEVSGVSNKHLAQVSKTANVELIKENNLEKFRDDKKKQRDIVLRNVTTGELKVNEVMVVKTLDNGTMYFFVNL